MANIYDVTDENFEEIVIEKSYEKPVLVDFWAQWCGPCKALKPLLEKLASEYDYILAKINVDENPHIAQEFGVQGIPDVKLFKDGKVIDQFVGAYPEPKLRDFLEKHIKSKVQQKLDEAKILILDGKVKEAEELFKQLLKDYPENKALVIEAAKFFINEGKIDEALKILDTIKEYHKEYYIQAQALKEIAKLKEACDNLKEETQLDKLYKKAACETVNGNYEEALKHFLQIVQLDKNYKDEAGRKGMITIFNILGERHPLTKEYRKKLAMALY
ncbi:thioredoxin [Hydrogenothermus marinus]|uniref:Thioredoxin n=1 Tax=Hydrogenothermus marinus TaxID=133270 RepID=A0A3M0C3W5_9AQUI|nr:thioredoxin [Hydrogenothermus marinus]RMA97652.1 thioredoxin [Hydrogenothermus marinus]